MSNPAHQYQAPVHHYHEHEESLVRYATEPPNVEELELEAYREDFFDNSARILCTFIEENLTLIVSVLALLCFVYMARPQVPDARYRGRFRRQVRELKEALAEKPAEREQRIDEALVVKVGHVSCTTFCLESACSLLGTSIDCLNRWSPVMMPKAMQR